MRDLIESALLLYPCFESESGMLFMRFFSVSVMVIGDLELPIKDFMYDPKTKSVYAEEDGVALTATPTLTGLPEVIEDSLQIDWATIDVSPNAIIFAWAIIAHTLNGTLTHPVLSAWINTLKSNWFSPNEALLRLRHEIFDLNANLAKRSN
jgi:hypothetical protein